jgi:tetraacyldisaccharide 4'-kinase
MTWGNPKNRKEIVRAGLLSPAAMIYGLANSLHRLSYDCGIRRKNKLPVPVISVGNITCGGTGKTPIVIAIVKHLLELGLKVGVLSRGYRRRGSSDITVVSDGQGNLASVLESGDEPYLIAQAAEKAVVMSGTNRFRAGIQAINQFGCDVFVLDDGYQHYSLERDFDIVLIDYNDEPTRDSLLPSGRLREPLTSLNRASHVIITKIPVQFDQQHLDSLELLVRCYATQVAITTSRFSPRRLIGFSDGKQTDLPLKSLKDMKVVAFCGLARPENFFGQVRELGATVLAERVFLDHHWYSAQDLGSLQKELRQTGAEFFITTEKDIGKISNCEFKSKLLTIGLEVDWLTGYSESLEKLVDTMVEKNNSFQLNELAANSAPSR